MAKGTLSENNVYLMFTYETTAWDHDCEDLSASNPT